MGAAGKEVAGRGDSGSGAGAGVMTGAAALDAMGGCVPVLVGLQRYGQTCYLVSLCQTLLRLDELSPLLIIASMSSDPRVRLLKALATLRARMINADAAGKHSKSVPCQDILRPVMEEFFPSFTKERAQDVFELLTQVVNRMRAEENFIFGTGSHSGGTLVHDLFFVQYASRLSCICGSLITSTNSCVETVGVELAQSEVRRLDAWIDFTARFKNTSGVRPPLCARSSCVPVTSFAH